MLCNMEKEFPDLIRLVSSKHHQKKSQDLSKTQRKSYSVKPHETCVISLNMETMYQGN